MFKGQQSEVASNHQPAQGNKLLAYLLDPYISILAPIPTMNIW